MVSSRQPSQVCFWSSRLALGLQSVSQKYLEQWLTMYIVNRMICSGVEPKCCFPLQDPPLHDAKLQLCLVDSLPGTPPQTVQCMKQFIKDSQARSVRARCPLGSMVLMLTELMSAVLAPSRHLIYQLLCYVCIHPCSTLTVLPNLMVPHTLEPAC